MLLTNIDHWDLFTISEDKFLLFPRKYHGDSRDSETKQNHLSVTQYWMGYWNL